MGKLTDALVSLETEKAIIISEVDFAFIISLLKKKQKKKIVKFCGGDAPWIVPVELNWKK